MQSMTDAQAGEAMKMSGLNRTEAHNAEFLEKARAEAYRIAIAHKRRFVAIDDIRRWADKNGLRPEQAAWGAVFKRCHKPGYKFILRYYKKSTYPSNRSRAVGVWQLQRIHGAVAV